MKDRFLDFIGYERELTPQETEAAEQRLRQKTVEFLTGKIDMDSYMREVDNGPKINFRKLADEIDRREKIEMFQRATESAVRLGVKAQEIIFGRKPSEE